MLGGFIEGRGLGEVDGRAFDDFVEICGFALCGLFGILIRMLFVVLEAMYMYWSGKWVWRIWTMGVYVSWRGLTFIKA
jgi:hypothetical protein